MALLAAAEQQGLEGIISMGTSRYVSGPTRTWLKIKSPTWFANNRQRFVYLRGGCATTSRHQKGNQRDGDDGLAPRMAQAVE
jgi:ATP-dependent DNA ligase